MSVGTRRTLWALVLVTVVVFPLTPTPAVRDLVQTVVIVVALAIAWRALWGRRELLRRGWGALVVAVSVLGLSDTVAAWELHVVDYTAHPRPSNLLALLGYVLLGVGVVQFERNRGRGRQLPGRFEAFIFAFGALTPLLVFLIIPVLQADHISLSSRVITVAYALADLVVMTVIARLLLTDSRQSLSLVFLCTALFVSLLGDFWSGITTTQGPSSELIPIKMLWLAAFILFAAGVAHSSMAGFTHGATWVDDTTSKRRVWLMGCGQSIPPVTLLVAWLLGTEHYDLVIGVSCLVVSTLVAARVTGLLDRISEQSVQLAALARSDDLTGLHNRRSWNHELSRACATARDQRQNLVIGLIDLDLFKDYNDTHGHQGGDRLLREASAVWQDLLRPNDVLARYGGEEFAVVLPDTDLHEAVILLDRLRLATPGNQTFSAGVALWGHGTEPSDAVASADAALYRAKRSGRNQVLAAEPHDETVLPSPLQALRIVVQPIVRATDLGVVGYEALSRFAHSDDVPLVFAHAHDRGYGDLLESTAISRALAVPGRPQRVQVFVNVTERTMRSSRFWEAVPADLTGVVVELHEDRDGLDDETVSGYLDRFRAKGARIALDDLGGGATDLTRITTLRPDIAKIDLSLVRGCDLDPGQAEVIRMLARFCRSRGVEVCAEGVETPGELATVRAAGCHLVQGYLVGRPEPEWLEPKPQSSAVAIARR